MNLKKILLFIFLLLVTAGIGYGLYFLFFKGPSAPPSEVTNTNVNAPIGGLPTAAPGAPQPGGAPVTLTPLPPGVSQIAQGGVTVVAPVASVPTTGASISAQGNLNYYNRTDGKFYRVNNDGSISTLTNKVFFNVDKTTFDPKGNKAILEYPDNSKILYDFNTNKQVTLPQHWESFNFSPDGEQMAAKSIGVDEANRFLVISNPDGSGAHAVQELGQNANKVQVTWSPNNQIIATAATGRSFGVDRQEIYFVGKNQENFKSMIVEGLDFRPSWTPNGERMLYSVAGSISDYKPDLWIVDAFGDNIGLNRKNLNINTWVDKCTFADNQTLYCAVPNTLDRGAGLQPDVAADTPDSIYRIDVTTGLQTKVAEPEGSHTIGKIMLSPDGKNLYFTEQQTGVINKIQLKP